jgi:hypothetical protein
VRGRINRFPGAAQHEVMRCRPGIVSNAEPAKVPALQCTTARCTASGTRDIVLATLHAPELCAPPPSVSKAKTKKGGEAPKGALFRELPLARQRDSLRETRPPSGAPPRRSPPAITPMTQPQTRVSAERGGTVFCRHAAKLPCVKYAPYRPVLLPADRCPRAARERFARPRAGIRTRSAYKIASGMRPSVSEIRRAL